MYLFRVSLGFEVSEETIRRIELQSNHYQLNHTSKGNDMMENVSPAVDSLVSFFHVQTFRLHHKMSTANLSSDEFEIDTISSAIPNLYLSKKLADFHFICKSHDGQVKRIPAHKFLLVVLSEVFRAMFNGSWIEQDEVEIVDASAEAFEEFLQFFYRKKATLTMENVAEVMNLGKKYDITECFNICAEYLKRNITLDNICWSYNLAIHLEHEKLRQLCEIIIGPNAEAVLSSDSFLECNPKTVERILQMDSLKCSEAEIFKSLLEWIKAQSQQNDLTREIVVVKYGDLLHRIRFGLMTSAEFVSLDPHSIFSYKEYVEIHKMITSAKYQPKIFNDNRQKRDKRLKRESNETIICNRFKRNCVSNPPYYMQNIESTKFSVNEHVWLTALGLDTIWEYRDGEFYRFEDVKILPSEITIIETNNSTNPTKKTILHKQKADLTTDTLGVNVPLSESVLVKPGLRYEIRMKQSPPPNCCTGVELKSVVELKSGVTVQFHDGKIVEGKIKGAIIRLTLEKV